IRENRHMLTGQTSVCDKVTEFFTRILIQIVELHSTEGRMGILSRCAHKWVEEIVLCIVLSDEPPERMGGIHGVSSTSCNLGVVGRLPASGGGIGAIILGCKELIRLLLKEGLRRSVPCATHFLNLLNKQLRGVTNKRWNLTRSESDELQKCLLRVVRSMPERPASPLPVVPPPCAPSVEAATNTVISRNSVPTLNQQQHEDQEAGPSRAADASAFIKEEPFWNCLDDNCDLDEEIRLGLQDIMKAKKEPPDPVSVSKQRPAVELESIKPDLGRVQEIRFRLNDDQNLSKIKAIAKQKPDESLKPVLAKEECGFGAAEEEDDDDEPLNVRRNRLIKSVHKVESSDSEVDSNAVGKTPNRSMHTSKENVESSTIVISDDDDDDSDNDERPNAILRSPEDRVLPKSPGRDYDDLSESQVFEFETQQYVASAWDESDFDASVLPKKPQSDLLLKPLLEEAPHEASPSSSETEPIPDEDIERACQQAEDKIREQQQPQEPADSCASSLAKPSSSAKNWDKFVKPKPLPVKSPKTTPSAKKQPKKPLIIDALAQKIRHHPWKRSSTSQDVEEPSSSTTPSAVSSSSPSSSCVSSPYFSASTSRGTPAIVPPKKVRKVVEPKSTAERLGLKKKERKAFELSQRSLDCVAKLRCHGQKVQVEPQQKMRRVCRTTKTSPQKRIAKGNKKLMGSQDIQFFRQSRAKNQRPATTLAPKPAKTKQPGETRIPKPTVASSEGGDFLHSPQPDPDYQQDNEKPATETSSRGDGVGNDTREESKYFQAGGSADVNMEEEPPPTRGSKDEDDEEWMFLTQMEPTDMELCSQMEQFEEENDEELFLTQRDPVDMDIDTDSESDTPGQPVLAPKPIPTPKPIPAPTGGNDDHLFLKPGMSPMSQKKAKPSTTKIYTPSSRSASLVLEMEKGAKPPPTANVAKAKIPRRNPPMPPPKTFQPLPALQLPKQLPLQPRPPPQLPKPLPLQPYPPPQLPKPLPLQPHPPPQLPKPLPLQQTPNAPKLVTSSKISSTSGAPSYKVYQRPEAPVNPPVNKPAPPMDQSPKFDLSVLTQAILKWEYRMLENYKAFGSPNDLCHLPLKRVPVQFRSYLEYFNTLYPLLLINAFEE
ncbi:hypothetical protein M9458_042761, partial [Cirrhinus mrigala]